MATRTVGAPTTEQMLTDRLTKLAAKNWSMQAIGNGVKFNKNIVEDVFRDELRGTKFDTRRIMMLEFSQYLENYLWPNYSPEVATHAYVMSLICMVNEKRRESVSAWDVFKKKPEHFGDLFTRMMNLILSKDCPLKDRTVILAFLDHCYSSLEVDVVRLQIQRTLTLATWQCLMPDRLQEELKKSTKLRKVWKAILKKDAKADEETKKKNSFDRFFLKNLINDFLSILSTEAMAEPIIDHCQRFLQLMIDLDSCLPTRRWFNTILDDNNFVVRCRMSGLYEQDDVFHQLVESLNSYLLFEVNDLTGEALTQQVRYQIFSHILSPLYQLSYIFISGNACCPL